MRLIPFSHQHLRIGDPLPFGLRDADGRLLLAAGASIGHAEQQAALMAQQLFADEAESAEWHRRLAAAVDAALRSNATLKEVAAVRPEPIRPEARDNAGPRLTLAQEWEQCALQLDALLREVADGRAGADAPARLAALIERTRALLARRPDAALYLQVYEAANHGDHYAARHALLVLSIVELAAPLLGWPAAAVDALAGATLTMNVGMLRLQDLLAVSDKPVTPELRAEIDRHPAVGAALLARAGLDDALMLSVVRGHHDDTDAATPIAALPLERQLARLLRRVDVFTAKISRRAGRDPMSPVRAAREACLGPDGQPDPVGGALLKAVGLYPPGSFVQLASGEVAIVIARGRRANLPIVASVVGASGDVLFDPLVRDTVEARHAVKAAVPYGAVRVRPAHERVLALRNESSAR